MPRVYPTLDERFWPNVDKRGPSDCWPWLGHKTRAERGMIRIDGRSRVATWAALALDGRPRPSTDHESCHSCDNPNCVNPAHLWWGTRFENMQDKVRKGRHHSQAKTHCLRGHPLSGENLRINSNGHRVCATCRAETDLRYYRKTRCQNPL